MTWAPMKNRQGCKDRWLGFKLHLDVADGQSPISAVVTSASVHDSQASIPVAPAAQIQSRLKPPPIGRADASQFRAAHHSCAIA
jgi:hypothetical protein